MLDLLLRHEVTQTLESCQMFHTGTEILIALGSEDLAQCDCCWQTCLFFFFLNKLGHQFCPISACVSVTCAEPTVPQDLQHTCLKCCLLQQLLMG